jgi:hypothetical protein
MEGRYIYRNLPGAVTVRRTAVGLVVICIIFLWAVFPIFIRSSDFVLVLTVNPSVNTECVTESACYKLQLENRGLWPVAIDIAELQVYPSLTGPSLNVNWLGPAPDKLLLLVPFTGLSCTFSIKIMGGLQPPDTVYAILTANVTVLFVTRQAVLHSGKR